MVAWVRADTEQDHFFERREVAAFLDENRRARRLRGLGDILDYKVDLSNKFFIQQYAESTVSRR